MRGIIADCGPRSSRGVCVTGGSKPPSLAWRPLAGKAIVALFLLALTCPYWVLLGGPVLGSDASGWMELGRIDAWSDLRAIFCKGHFIGYRPLTALSFAIGAYPEQQWLVHAVDLFALFGVLSIFYWTLTRAAGLTTFVACLATAAVAFHPVVEDVVAFSDRRGDLLVAGFGTGYLCSVLRGSPSRFRLAWLTLALASKEGAFALPVAAFAAHLRSDDRRFVSRLAGGVRRVVPEVVLVLSFLVVRVSVLGGFGGYVAGGAEGARALIPVDYFAGVLVPHLPALLSWSAALGFTFAAVALAAWLSMAITKDRASRLFLCAFVADLLVYVATGSLWSRLLLPACLFATVPVWVALSHGSRVAKLFAIVVIGTWIALHACSNPVSRLRCFVATASRYCEALESEASRLPEGDVQLVLCDFPEGWEKSPLERRPEWSSGQGELGRQRYFIVTALHVARLVNARHPERRLKLLPLVHLLLQQPDARWSAQPSMVREESPSTLRIDLSTRHAKAFVFASIPSLTTPFIQPTESGYRVEMNGLRPHKIASFLFLATAPGQRLLAHPDVLEIHFSDP